MKKISRSLLEAAKSCSKLQNCDVFGLGLAYGGQYGDETRYAGYAQPTERRNSYAEPTNDGGGAKKVYENQYRQPANMGRASGEVWDRAPGYGYNAGQPRKHGAGRVGYASQDQRKGSQSTGASKNKSLHPSPRPSPHPSNSSMRPGSGTGHKPSAKGQRGGNRYRYDR